MGSAADGATERRSDGRRDASWILVSCAVVGGRADADADGLRRRGDFPRAVFPFQSALLSSPLLEGIATE